MASVIKDRVKENSTSTGTGSFALSGATLGFRAFSTVCSVGDTFRYAIQAVDTNGAPSGGWEVGVGTYSSANTLTRTSVIDSSNAGSVVDFSTGTKEVWIGMDATMAAWPRERLTAARTYYVRTDGSDSNNGLADSSGGAFLAIQKAIDVICETLDTSIYVATVQVKDGTYTGGVTLKAHIGSLPYVIQGNATTPSNVHINVTGACFVSSDNRTTAKIKNMKLTSTSASVYASAGIIEIAEGIEFAAATGGHISTQYQGYINCTANYTISGGGGYHMQASNQSKIRNPSKTITLTGTPAFSTAFAVASNSSHIVCLGNSYSGSATGVRYSVTMNATIDSGATTLPGNSAGTTATGGQYA